MIPSQIQLPQDELNFTYARSSGAGGQNVNKVNSKAILRWNPARSRAMPEPVRQRFLERFGSKLTKGGEGEGATDGDLIIMSDRFRDQGRNAADCLEKLREMIASVWRPPKVRRATKPTYGSKVRRLKSKKEHGEKKKGRSWRPD